MIPREIWRLTGALYERLPRAECDVSRLFVANGDEAEVREIRECIDTGENKNVF